MSGGYISQKIEDEVLCFGIAFHKRRCIVKKNRVTIIVISILLILVNILNVLAPYFLKLIIDKITANTIR